VTGKNEAIIFLGAGGQRKNAKRNNPKSKRLFFRVVLKPCT